MWTEEWGDLGLSPQAWTHGAGRRLLFARRPIKKEHTYGRMHGWPRDPGRGSVAQPLEGWRVNPQRLSSRLRNHRWSILIYLFTSHVIISDSGQLPSWLTSGWSSMWVFVGIACEEQITQRSNPGGVSVNLLVREVAHKLNGRQRFRDTKPTEQ